MEKKDLIKKLNQIYGEMEEFESDDSLHSLAKSFTKIKENFSDLINELENEE